MTDNPAKCQKCGSPLTPGMKFCESCGTKIETVTACPKCGGALVPNMKFCGICGATLDPAAPAQKKTAEAIPVAAETAPVSPPAPGKTPVTEVKSPVKSEEKAIPVPKEKPVPVKESQKTETAKELPKETGGKKPMSPATMIIAGIVILALLGAGVFFVGLPMLSGSGGPAQTPPASPAGTGSGTPAPSDGSSQAGSSSLVAGPTDVLPNKFALIIDVEKNAISRDIIVTFQGGEGQYGVRELAVKVTRSDGTTETKLMKTPLERGDSITVKGTEKSDRVEITAKFHSGETYKVVDKVFEYKKRVGSS